MENNVIKMKPPMTFSSEDAQRVVREIRSECSAILAECTARGVVTGVTAGHDASVSLVDAAAAFYAAHPELVPVPLSGGA